jgi:hypothetical protein
MTGEDVPDHAAGEERVKPPERIGPAQIDWISEWMGPRVVDEEFEDVGTDDDLDDTGTEDGD